MTILEILMWALPSGFASGIATYLLSRRTFNAKQRREREETYKSLYDSLSETTVDMANQLKKLNNKIITYETALRKLYHCKYADRCPALIWMQSEPRSKLCSRPLGQSASERNRANHLRAGPDEDGDAQGECIGMDEPDSGA